MLWKQFQKVLLFYTGHVRRHQVEIPAPDPHCPRLFGQAWSSEIILTLKDTAGLLPCDECLSRGYSVPRWNLSHQLSPLDVL